MALILIGLIILVLDQAVDGDISAAQAAVFIVALVLVLGLGRRGGARARFLTRPIETVATVAGAALLVISIAGGGPLAPALGGVLVLGSLIFALWIIVAAPFGRRR